MDDTQQQPLHDLVPIFARASVGDFPTSVPIPSIENEFTPLYVGVQIMLDVIHEKIASLEQANQELREKYEQEKAIEKLKDDFLAFAAHQLRNPLVNIRWTTELLLEQLQSDVPEQLRSKLVRIYENNLQLITLTDDILSSARIESGQWQETPKDERIVDVIQHVILEQSVEAKTKEMTVEFSYEPQELSHMTFLFDAKLFEQIVQNILANALKYGNKGTAIQIHLKWDGNELIMSVHNQGMGIPEKDQPHIFERFYRGSNVLASPITGSGLGLYVVRQLLEHWNGKIWFESKENVGITMYISLPLPKGAP